MSKDVVEILFEKRVDWEYYDRKKAGRGRG